MRVLLLLAAGALFVSVASYAGQGESKPRPYTLVVEGSVCPGCAGELATAIKGVEGAKVVTAPGKGAGEKGVTLTVVELSGKAGIGAVTAAVEKAKTPHSEKVPPGVTGVLPFKVKSTATLEDIQKALKAAMLLEE